MRGAIIIQDLCRTAIELGIADDLSRIVDSVAVAGCASCRVDIGQRAASVEECIEVTIARLHITGNLPGVIDTISRAVMAAGNDAQIGNAVLGVCRVRHQERDHAEKCGQ